MADNVADLTLAHVRKIDQTVSRIWEVMERHETRLPRIERHIGEMKSDQVLMENRMLNRRNEILALVERIEDHGERLERLEHRADV